MQGNPDLGPHWTTAVNTEVIGGHMFEGLFTLDDTNQPIPMLAESHAVSRDGLSTP
jgi:ABC-type transport system substrate-binding protein